MKYSLYNSLIPITADNAILYNALSDKFLVVNKDYAALLQSPPGDIEQCYESFYSNLTKDGFCVEDDFRETEFAIERGVERCTTDNGYFQIIINPTMRCNFRCWYCYEQHDGMTKMKAHTVERVKKLIRSIVSREDVTDFHLSFFGGEPLLYYKDCVQPLIDFSREVVKEFDKTLSISFTSNGYLLNDKVISHLVENGETVSFQITLDGHRELHNKVRFTQSGDGSYDRILENIRKLIQKGIHVSMRINYTSANIQSANAVLDDIRCLTAEERRYLSIDFQKVWQEKDSVEKSDCTEEVVGNFKKEFGRIGEHYSRVDTFHNPCYGDRTNSVVINYNGDVYKCTARDFVPTNRLGRLMSNGEIKWDKENILKDRLRDKFSNPACRKCRIFPLCGGGCVQTSSDIGFKGCLRQYTPDDKDKIILSRFYERVVSRHEKKD